VTDAVAIDDIRAAARRLDGRLVKTPCTRSKTLSHIVGCDLFLKFENLQFTSSFKERGALNCLLCLSEEERSRGVIAMSAGNHAQALAYHGRRLGVPTTIVMPRFTPNAKVAQTRVFEAEVILFGNEFDEARRHTLALAEERGLTRWRMTRHTHPVLRHRSRRRRAYAALLCPTTSRRARPCPCWPGRVPSWVNLHRSSPHLWVTPRLRGPQLL
jgi:threonine dehydratase